MKLYRRLIFSFGLMVAACGARAGEFVVQDIQVDGLQRISAGTVFAALPVGVGARRTVYLVGDGTNQDLAMFTFGEGIIDSEGDERLFLPAIRRQ